MSTALLDSAALATPSVTLAFVISILDSAGKAIVVAGLDGTILLWNQGAERIYGYTAEEVVGLQSIDILHPPGSVAGGILQQKMEAALRDGRWKGVVPGRHRSGAALQTSMAISPRYDSRNDSPGGVRRGHAGFVVVAEQVGERAVAEAPSKSRLFDEAMIGDARGAVDLIANILESSTEYSIIGKDMDGGIVLWNEGARRNYGYTASEVVGIANAAILHVPEDVASGRPREMLAAALRDGKWEGNMLRQRRNGERFTARIVVTPRFNTARQPIGYLLISKNISEELRLGALQAKNVELENASLAKDRFLASMSHELRTPLNAIMGFTGTLLMRLPGPLNADQERQLRIVQTSSKHLLSLINDLLDLAKVEAGSVPINLEHLACQPLIEEVAATLRPFAETKRLRFELSLPAVPITVVTERRALIQILINLVNNAIKFTAEGSVQIELVDHHDASPPWVEVSVADTGPGIRLEDQGGLFEAFTQIDNSSTRAYEGTGLGLHVSQKLAKMIGGVVTFESEYGQGSRFTLSLPVAVQDVPGPEIGLPA